MLGAEGGTQKTTVSFHVTVLFLPTVPAPGHATAEGAPVQDNNEHWYYPKITVFTPGGQKVPFVLVPKRNPSDGPDSFYVMVTKVSVGLFREFAESPEGKQEAIPDTWQTGNLDKQYYQNEYPVFRVPWHHANRFAKWLCQGVLPSREEWDKAAGLKEWNGKDTDTGPFQGKWDPKHPLDIAITPKVPPNRPRPEPHPRPVGEAKADVSPFDCRDMAGNGEEWTSFLISSDPGKVELRGSSFESDVPFLFADLMSKGRGTVRVGGHGDVAGLPSVSFRVVINPR
jgi:formylglycine-generating enzyme required for sulfatase activity